MKSEIFVHVGLMKTGTTFLAKEVYPKIKNIHYEERCDLDQCTENGKNLFFNQCLSGRPHLLGRTADMALHRADNLKALYPNAKIILNVRNKNAWLNSVYREYVRFGGNLNFLQFYDNFDKNFLDFNGYINYLKKLFGTENVYVSDYETLNNNPEEYIKDLCNFVDCEIPIYTNRIVRPSLSDQQVRLGKFLNNSYWRFNNILMRISNGSKR